MWESYGEDSYVNAQMAVEAVKGFQGENPNRIDKYHVATSLKHFMGYGVPVSGKDRTPSSISEIDLREKHFRSFFGVYPQRCANSHGQFGCEQRNAFSRQ